MMTSWSKSFRNSVAWVSVVLLLKYCTTVELFGGSGQTLAYEAAAYLVIRTKVWYSDGLTGMEVSIPRVPTQGSKTNWLGPRLVVFGIVRWLRRGLPRGRRDTASSQVSGSVNLWTINAVIEVYTFASMPMW